MKGQAANGVILRAQRALTNIRIGQINNRLVTIENRIAELTDTLGSHVPEGSMKEILEWVKVAKSAEWDRSRMRQRNKFEKMATKTPPDKNNIPIAPVSEQQTRNLKDRWVENLSDRSLTKAELSVLEKGLNYAVAPKTLPIGISPQALKPPVNTSGQAQRKRHI